MRAVILVMALAVAGCTASTPATDTAPAAARASQDGPLLHIMDCGNITVSDKSLFNPGVDAGQPIELRNTCYLIVHPRGKLLWDTGLPDALAGMPDGLRSAAFHVRRSTTLAEQLERLGHAPASIDYLAISHLHSDHAGNANLFARSTWLVQKPERDVAFSDQAGASGFDRTQYDSLRHARTTVLTGDHDVFGDGSVMILSTPGHTIGHQVLLLRLPVSGPVLLSGDLWHFRENRERRGVPVFNWDKAQTLASMDRIEQVLRDNNARLIIQHDPQHVAALGPLPAVLR